MHRFSRSALVGAAICIALFLSYDAWEWLRHGSIFIRDDDALGTVMYWLRFPGGLAAAFVTFCVYQNIHDYNGYFFRCAEILANSIFYSLLISGVLLLFRQQRKPHHAHPKA